MLRAHHPTFSFHKIVGLPSRSSSSQTAEAHAARHAEPGRNQAPAWTAVASNYAIYSPFCLFRAMVYFTILPPSSFALWTRSAADFKAAGRGGVFPFEFEPLCLSDVRPALTQVLGFVWWHGCEG